jgi:hypothetical protein
VLDAHSVRLAVNIIIMMAIMKESLIEPQIMNTMLFFLTWAKVEQKVRMQFLKKAFFFYENEEDTFSSRPGGQNLLEVPALCFRVHPKPKCTTGTS